MTSFDLPLSPKIPSAPLSVAEYRAEVIKQIACPYCKAGLGEPCRKPALGADDPEAVTGYIHDDRSVAHFNEARRLFEKVILEAMALVAEGMFS